MIIFKIINWILMLLACFIALRIPLGKMFGNRKLGAMLKALFLIGITLPSILDYLNSSMRAQYISFGVLIVFTMFVFFVVRNGKHYFKRQAKRQMQG